jgi:hypothetical protein
MDVAVLINEAKPFILAQSNPCMRPAGMIYRVHLDSEHGAHATSKLLTCALDNTLLVTLR